MIIFDGNSHVVGMLWCLVLLLLLLFLDGAGEFFLVLPKDWKEAFWNNNILVRCEKEMKHDNETERVKPFPNNVSSSWKQRGPWRGSNTADMQSTDYNCSTHTRLPMCHAAKYNISTIGLCVFQETKSTRISFTAYQMCHSSVELAIVENWSCIMLHRLE